MAQTQITQEYVEVLSSSNAATRINQMYVEVLTTPSSDTIVSHLYVEVLSSGEEEPPTPPVVATDTVDSVALPTIQQSGNPPTWVTQRGQDVRVFDVDDDRLVFGPSHSFEDPDDCVITNGMIRARFGAEGSVAQMAVEAFKDNSWRDLGSVFFAAIGDVDELTQRVRLSRLTREIGTVVIETRDAGPIHVTLQRGERMFRVQHGEHLIPFKSRLRRMQWDSVENGSGMVNGRIIGTQTAESLVRGMCVLDDGFSSIANGNVGVSITAEVAEVGVFVAVTGSTPDSPGSHHKQYSGDFEQELRLR